VIDDVRASGGDFSTWLNVFPAVLAQSRDADVPCEGCDACCRSSQFVHIAPDEYETLGRIPEELLFPAPGASTGHVLMGYDEQGRCPMLTENGCAIYDQRPRTCRSYDCRVFTAAGVEPDPDKPLIVEQARRWQFEFAGAPARRLHNAVRSAAGCMQDNTPALPAALAPRSQTELAVLAVDIHAAFLEAEPDKVDLIGLLRARMAVC
jgi:hypothetical protein